MSANPPTRDPQHRLFLKGDSLADRFVRSPRSRVRPALLAGLSLVLALPAYTIAQTEPAQDEPSQTPPAQAEPAQLEDLDDPGQALSARYQLQERYTDAPNTAKPELLNQYQVGYRQTVKTTREKPQGAPEVNEMVLQMIYSERVGAVNKKEFPTEIIRQYEKVNYKNTKDLAGVKPESMANLSILYRIQNSWFPQVISLAGRQLYHYEYTTIAQQPYLPFLVELLPRQPARKGDTWPVPIPAVWAMLGVPPLPEGLDLQAELIDVHKTGVGPTMVAVISVKGECVVPQGPSGINAQLYFTFEPSAPELPNRAGGFPAAVPNSGGSDGKPQGIFGAKGYFSKISLAQEFVQPLPEEDGRLSMKVRRVLLTERRKFDPASSNTAAIVVPNPTPEPTIDNSWLIYDDPKGRFHFTFPQELHINSDLTDDAGVALLEPPQAGRDVIELRLVPKTGNAQTDRLAADPVQEKKQIENLWRDSGQKVVAGTSGWLNDAEWARLGRKVYRIEAAMIEDAAAPGRSNDRLYTDRYIVQFTRNETLKVWAMTNREPHVEFRDKAESVIKSFQFGPYANAGAIADPANLAPPADVSPEPDTLPDRSTAPPPVEDDPPPIDSSAPPEAPR